MDNPPLALRATSPTRGEDKVAVCAKHCKGGEVYNVQPVACSAKHRGKLRIS